MNGRIYDPLIGRFLSADIIVQAPANLQSYNRYSYVMNNPLTLTDPSGFAWWSNVLDAVKDFAGGVVAGVIEANDFTGHTSARLDAEGHGMAGNLGRIVGNVAAMVQGQAEINGGGTMMAAGAAMMGVGGAEAVLASPTVVGSAPGVAAVAGGAAVATAGVVVTAHGAAVAANGGYRALRNVERLTRSEVNTGSDGGKVRPEQPRDAQGRWKSPEGGEAPPGKQGEATIHKKLGTEQNTSKISGEEGASIPDILEKSETGSVTRIGEIKDTAVVNDSPQMRIQREVAEANGIPHEVHAGTDAKVSRTVEENSTVFRHDEIGPRKP